METVLLVELWGDLRIADVLRADGLVVAENLKGSALPTEDLEAESSGVRTLPKASNKVLPEMLKTSCFWLLQKPFDTNLTFVT